MTAVRRAARRRRPTARWARRARSIAARRQLAVLRRPAARRVLLVAALLAVVFFPLPGLASDGQSAQPACHGCAAVQPAITQDWAVPLSGAWVAGNGSGAGGTVPASGQAYVAVGGGVAVLGDGLTLTAYAISDGDVQWQVTLDEPFGATIMSVRAWPEVVTVGILSADGRTRTEVVLAAASGEQLRHYQAAVFGGAVAASLATTVVVGATDVTSYDNATGRVIWRVPTGQDSAWRADPQTQTLYVADSAGGYLSSSPVTALTVINLESGAERTLSSPLGSPFSGTLAIAADGAVLFTSAGGVTAYNGSTGYPLWSLAGSVPEGTDPAANLVYLTSGGTTLTGVDPLTGQVKTSVSGSTAGGAAGMYVVRGGVALGLDSGANGEAWGYDVAAGRVTWTSPLLPWPHYFSDLSGLGGSAAISGDMVVVTACPHLTGSAGACANPELVAFTL